MDLHSLPIQTCYPTIASNGRQILMITDEYDTDDKRHPIAHLHQPRQG